MKEEAITGLRTLNLTNSAEQIKTLGAVLKTQYNMANMFWELPSYIKEIEEAQERAQVKSEKMGAAQEGGSI